MVVAKALTGTRDLNQLGSHGKVLRGELFLDGGIHFRCQAPSPSFTLPYLTFPLTLSLSYALS